MNENVLRATDVATIANWIMIIGAAVLLAVSTYVTRNSKKARTSKSSK